MNRIACKAFPWNLIKWSGINKDKHLLWCNSAVHRRGIRATTYGHHTRPPLFPSHPTTNPHAVYHRSHCYPDIHWYHFFDNATLDQQWSVISSLSRRALAHESYSSFTGSNTLFTGSVELWIYHYVDAHICYFQLRRKSRALVRMTVFFSWCRRCKDGESVSPPRTQWCNRRASW